MTISNLTRPVSHPQDGRRHYRDGSGYGLREVFCDHYGRPYAIAPEFPTFATNSEICAIEDIEAALKCAWDDVRTHPIFEEPAVEE
jgi:hypothetical protein